MTYDRVVGRWTTSVALDGAVVSHMAELVRGDLSAQMNDAAIIRPLRRDLRPQGEKALRVRPRPRAGQ